MAIKALLKDGLSTLCDNIKGVRHTAEDANNLAGLAGAGVLEVKDIADQALEKAETAERCYYGTSSTSAGTTTKTVECSDFTLDNGKTIWVKFTNKNTASSPKLNVNGTGAKSIMMYGTTAPNTNTWIAGSVVAFTYDGTNWIMQQGADSATINYAIPDGVSVSGVSTVRDAIDYVLEVMSANGIAISSDISTLQDAMDFILSHIDDLFKSIAAVNVAYDNDFILDEYKNLQAIYDGMTGALINASSVCFTDSYLCCSLEEWIYVWVYLYYGIIDLAPKYDPGDQGMAELLTSMLLLTDPVHNDILNFTLSDMLDRLLYCLLYITSNASVSSLSESIKVLADRLDTSEITKAAAKASSAASTAGTESELQTLASGSIKASEVLFDDSYAGLGADNIFDACNNYAADISDTYDLIQAMDLQNLYYDSDVFRACGEAFGFDVDELNSSGIALTVALSLCAYVSIVMCIYWGVFYLFSDSSTNSVSTITDLMPENLSEMSDDEIAGIQDSIIEFITKLYENMPSTDVINNEKTISVLSSGAARTLASTISADKVIYAGSTTMQDITDLCFYYTFQYLCADNVTISNDCAAVIKALEKEMLGSIITPTDFTGYTVSQFLLRCFYVISGYYLEDNPGILNLSALDAAGLADADTSAKTLSLDKIDLDAVKNSSLCDEIKDITRDIIEGSSSVNVSGQSEALSAFGEEERDRLYNLIKGRKGRKAGDN